MVEQYYDQSRYLVTFGGLQFSDFLVIDKWCVKTWGEPSNVNVGASDQQCPQEFWYTAPEGWIVGTFDQAVMMDLTWSAVYGS